jgi:hypothetical protein
VAGLLPPEDLAAPCDRGCQVRDHRNIVALEDAGIRAYVPLTDFAHRTDFYGQDVFVFDPDRDEYRCPQGHLLRRYSTNRTDGVVAYRGEAAVCNACPVKTKCTTSDHGRKVQQSFYIDYLEKVQGYLAMEPTSQQCASGRSGSSRCSRTPRSGTAYADSDCGAS